MNFTNLIDVIMKTPPLEWAGFVTGAIAVSLAVRTNMGTWAWGIVNALIYGYLFWESAYYSSMALFLLYFLPMQFYGYWSWKRGGVNADTLPVTRLGIVGLVPYLLGAGAFTVGWGYLMVQAQAALPYVDAFQTGLSVVAQFLMARKKVESWWLWITVNLICAFFLYPAQKLFVTAGLFLVYLVLAVLGLLEWQRLSQKTNSFENAVQSEAQTEHVRNTE